MSTPLEALLADSCFFSSPSILVQEILVGDVGRVVCARTGLGVSSLYCGSCQESVEKDCWVVHSATAEHKQNIRRMDRVYNEYEADRQCWVTHDQVDATFEAVLAESFPGHTTRLERGNWSTAQELLWLCCQGTVERAVTRFPASCFALSRPIERGSAHYNWMTPLLHTLGSLFQEPVETMRVVTNKHGYSVEEPVPVEIPTALQVAAHMLTLYAQLFIFPGMYQFSGMRSFYNPVSELNDWCVQCQQRVSQIAQQENHALLHQNDHLAEFLTKTYTKHLQLSVMCSSISSKSNEISQTLVHTAQLYSSVHTLSRLLHHALMEAALEHSAAQSPVVSAIIEKTATLPDGSSCLYLKTRNADIQPDTCIFVSLNGANSLNLLGTASSEFLQHGIGSTMCENTRSILLSAVSSLTSQTFTPLQSALCAYLFPANVTISTPPIPGVFQGTISNCNNRDSNYAYMRICIPHAQIPPIPAGTTVYTRSSACWTNIKRICVSARSIFNTLPWNDVRAVFPNGTAVFLSEEEENAARQQPQEQISVYHEKLEQRDFSKMSLSRLNNKENERTNTLTDASTLEKVFYQLYSSRQCCILGPPGTGKSTTLVSLISSLLQRGELICVVSQTNAAVDSLSAKLTDIPHVRFTSGIPTHDIKSTHLLLGTCSGMGNTAVTTSFTESEEHMHDWFQIFQHFTYLIVDEAGQCPNFSLLPVLALAPRARILLAGDPFQLPPFTRLDYQVPTLLAEQVESSVWLTTQYRMHWILGYIVSYSTYSGKVHSCKPDDTFVHHMQSKLYDLQQGGYNSHIRTRAQVQNLMNQVYPGNKHLLLPYIPPYNGQTIAPLQLGPTLLKTKVTRNFVHVNKLAQPREVLPVIPYISEGDVVISPSPQTVIDIRGQEQPQDASFVNIAEAAAIARIVSFLCIRMPTLRVAVLSQYKAQVRYLEQLLSTSSSPTTIISSVDAFQGQEADVVLLSMVRTTRPGFSVDPNRSNVAISRAKSNFVLVLHAPLYSQSRNAWSFLLDTAKKLQCVHSETEIQEFFK